MIHQKLYTFVEQGVAFGPFSETELLEVESRAFSVKLDSTSGTLRVLPASSDAPIDIPLDGLRRRAIEVLEVLAEHPKRVIATPLLDLLGIELQDQKELNKLVQQIRDLLHECGVPQGLIQSRKGLPPTQSLTGQGYQALTIGGRVWQVVRLAAPVEANEPTRWPE